MQRYILHLRISLLVFFNLFFTLYLGLCTLHAEAPPSSPFAKSTAVVPSLESDSTVSSLDQAILNLWGKERIPTPLEASDGVFIRRAYLDLVGRLPSPQEARLYIESSDVDKREKLISDLLNDKGFASYWTLRLGDALRIKSEFPINLWPNAVYAYTQFLRDSLSQGKPMDTLLRELMTAEGSNFYTPPVNFYRAVPDKTPEAMAQYLSPFLLGLRLDTQSPVFRKNLTAFFSQLRYKPTKEWKEEIVYTERSSTPTTLTLPNGKSLKAPAHTDYRALLADYLLDPKSPVFARAFVNRTWYYFFGKGLVGDPDNLSPKALLAPHPILDELTRTFVTSNYDLKTLCRAITNSIAYRTASAPGKDSALTSASTSSSSEKPSSTSAPSPAKSSAPSPAKPSLKTCSVPAVFPIRRLDAEVLDDILRDLAPSSKRLSSVIPEPFTFLPQNYRSIDLPDGSITSPFLTLFGKPARDSGLLDERPTHITEKQRLYLFNSKDLYERLTNRLEHRPFIRLDTPAKINTLYLTFLSRFPTEEERTLIRNHITQISGEKRKDTWFDIAWTLLNGKEFLYQH